MGVWLAALWASGWRPYGRLAGGDVWLAHEPTEYREEEPMVLAHQDRTEPMGAESLPGMEPGVPLRGTPLSRA